MAQLTLDGYFGINTEIASLLVENHKYATDYTENEELWEILENTATKVDISIGEEYEDAAWFDLTFLAEINDSHISYEGVTRSITGVSVVGKDNPKYETLRFIAKTGMTATIESIDEGVIFINGATKED